MDGIMKYIGHLIVISISLVLVFSCAKKKEETPVVSTALIGVVSVTGKVVLEKNGNLVSASDNIDLENGDVVETKEASRAVIHVGKSRNVYMNQSTKLRIDYVQGENNSEVNFNISLSAGEIFCNYIQPENVRSAFAVTTPSSSIIGNESSFSVAFEKSTRQTTVRSLNRDVSVFPNKAKDCLDVQTCNTVAIAGDGVAGKFVYLTSGDIEELNQWVGTETIEALAKNLECVKGKELVEDLPPEWIKKTGKTCNPGDKFLDTVCARDPEGGRIHYKLAKAPKGMKIDESSGRISYTPQKPGNYGIRLCAEDETGNVSYMNYTLTVTGNLNAVLVVPEKVIAGQKCVIDASKSTDNTGKTTGLLFRYDFEGDGTWDYPGKGAYTEESSVQHIFAKPGECAVTLEIKSKKGETAVASKTIMVEEPGQLKITVTPEKGGPGTEFSLAGRLFYQGRESSEKFKVRWDFNGDGTWDSPSDNSYGDLMDVKHVWDKTGVYAIKAEALDKNNLAAAAAVQLTIYKGIIIDKITAPDTINVNTTVTAVCAAHDSENAIVEYAWDFAGTGMFQNKSKKSEVSLSYKEPGAYTLVCSVTNDKGMSASASKQIVVVNNATVVDARGPYKTFVNIPITVEGYANDIDNKFTSYAWDFDNDGKNDWQSDKAAKTEHVYKKAGTYTVRFSAQTDDGKVTTDTTTVVVINRPPRAHGGGDIITHKGKTVKLKGVGEDPDGNIIKYEWDFNCDGTYDWESKDTGLVTHAFKEYARTVFRVTDGEGACAVDTIRIVICPEGMETVEDGKFCIDTYEWPDKKGKKPLVNVTQEQAASECKKAGKRLCTADEMRDACQGGKQKYEYPYGKYFDPEKCNTYGNRHLENQVAKTGEFKECVNKYGISDMSGNVAEWTSSVNGEIGYAAGGWWQSGEKQSRCDSYLPLKKNKKYVYTGFRCCK